MTTFTSDASQYSVLRAGGKIDVGWLPTNAAPAKSADKPIGRNPVAGYTLQPTAFWGAMGLPLNFNNPTVGPLLRQAYIRQALQSTVNQPGYVQAFLAGYGTVQTGPIPAQADTPYRSALAKGNGPFPFNLEKATSILRENGWEVAPNGTSRCVRPGSGAGQCGADIGAGTELEFTAQYVNNPPQVDQQMQQWKSDAAKAGISLTLNSGPFGSIFAASQPCTSNEDKCSWQITNFTGFGYYPYPVGDQFFASKTGTNWGHYNDSKADELIDRTLVDSSPPTMQAYDEYLATQVPMIWFPTPAGVLYEVNDKLRGVIPEGSSALPAALTNPEHWYFVK